MNFRRGLFRLWIVGSALFVPASALFHHDIGSWAAAAFGIPLMILVLGSSLLWALSGFAVTRK
jgi:hypothetical protein